MGLQYEPPWLKSKGQPWPLKLIKAIVSFGLTYQVRVMTGLNSFQKMNFKKKSHLNALGSKFDHDRK